MLTSFYFSQQVHAVLPPEAWDETYFSLLSLKHALAGVPGWKRMEIMANNEADGTVRLRVITTWATLEQMEAWLKSALTVEGLLKAMTPPPVAIDVHFDERIS
jgi:heme-degrading monooxygenase HmoA